MPKSSKARRESDTDLIESKMLMQLRSTLSRLQSQQRAFHASMHRSLVVRSLTDPSIATKQTAKGMESRRVLLRRDECGFSMHQDVFRRGQAVPLAFQNHVYAFTVTEGTGTLRVMNASTSNAKEIPLQQGSFIALNGLEEVEIEAASDQLVVLSVMNPPLVGTEARLDNGVFPVVDPDGVALEAYDHSTARRLFEPPETLRGGSLPMKDDPLF